MQSRINHIPMMRAMQHYRSNDGYTMAYQSHGENGLPQLILLHGFTGSSSVFERNIPALSKHYHITIPDLRGHGDSAKTPHGFHVSRLAMDLHNFLEHLKLTTPGSVSCIAGSLGCAILWSYAEMFTADVFGAMIWVDQSPMQNYALDGSWGEDMGNRGMNCEAAVKKLIATLKRNPDEVYSGTIAGCLGYRSHPIEGEIISEEVRKADESFFLDIARQGDAEWYGDLMANHTALDWRQTIIECFGGRKENDTRVLVIASSRSGCFPAAGPMEAVRLANLKAKVGRAEGVVVDWGGHWCYWEDPARFDQMALEFLLRT